MATDKPMQLGMVGLGRMGAGIVRRLMADGHRCVGYDVNPDAVAELEKEGAGGATTLEDFVAQLEKPRAVWVMVPAGQITNKTIAALGEVLEHWKVKKIGVEMQNIEVSDASAHLVQHHQMGGDIRLESAAIEPNGLFAPDDKIRLGCRVGARKQRYLVAKVDERLAEVGNNSFCATIEHRRHGLVQGGNLRDLQSPVFHRALNMR